MNLNQAADRACADKAIEAQPVVAQQVRRILQALAVAGEATERLTVSLDQVLTPEHPTPMTNGATVMPVSTGCPLTHQLREIAERAEALGAKLMRTRDRLEV